MQAPEPRPGDAVLSPRAVISAGGALPLRVLGMGGWGHWGVAQWLGVMCICSRDVDTVPPGALSCVRCCCCPVQRHGAGALADARYFPGA